MDFWNKARSFVDEASKRSQELTIGSSTLYDIVLETAKRSRDFAAEASKRADQIRAEAVKRADKIKSITAGAAPSGEQEIDLERFGITEDLREFVKGITKSTFQDFPMQDDSPVSDVPTISNVRQDLTEWKAKHANLVLSTVTEISKLRYELCPRVMKERKFWRIYFILVNSHVAPYEKRYMEESRLKSTSEVVDETVIKSPKTDTISETEVKEPKEQSRAPTSVSTEQDLDVFLLGGDSDENPGVCADDGGSDDDRDELVNGSDDEEQKLRA